MSKKIRRSSVVPIGKIFKFIQKAADNLYDDHVALFAAQASFFTVISAIPFLMLLIGLAKLIFHDLIDAAFVELEIMMPENFTAPLTAIYEELSERTGVSIVSISAVTMFWSSSRGVAAVTRGVAGVYGTREHTNFILEILRSFFYTIMFIVSIIAVLLLLVFGATIRDMVVIRFPNTRGIFDLIINLRVAVIFVVLMLFFSLIYHAVSRNGLKNGASHEAVPAKYRTQLPGAAIASLGWMLYSYFYSLYIEYFPSASYIYGSLAAVIFLMLWLYFCMMIFLVGAEINKGLYMLKKRK